MPHYQPDSSLCVFLSGILRTAVPDMDRETQDQYLVLLQAKDMGGHLGGLSGTTTVTVKLTDVNDNPPRFTQSELLSRRPRRVKASQELSGSVTEGEGLYVFGRRVRMWLDW